MSGRDVVRHVDFALHWLLASNMQGKTSSTRQLEMANTSPRHMPVLGNVHPIKIEKFDILFVTSFLCSLEFLYF